MTLRDRSWLQVKRATAAADGAAAATAALESHIKATKAEHLVTLEETAAAARVAAEATADAARAVAAEVERTMREETFAVQQVVQEVRESETDRFAQWQQRRRVQTTGSMVAIQVSRPS